LTAPDLDLGQQGLPQHVAIIMDGNNRYARRQGLGQGAGHLAGKNNLDPIVEQARRLGIRALTVFAFSSENWRRPPDEVALLMQLLAETIHEQMIRMHRYQIAMRFIGDRSRMSQRLMTQAESETAHHQSMSLVIAVSYGGIWDMTQAARKVAQQVAQGLLQPEHIDESILQQHLEIADLPPVDLLIRTGGDYRLSNFLLWQAAYAELYFTNTLWPDFSVAEFEHALNVFAGRERRFGRTSEQVHDFLATTPHV
jgi:undecaprenyl diphosphate synthase